MLFPFFKAKVNQVMRNYCDSIGSFPEKRSIEIAKMIKKQSENDTVSSETLFSLLLIAYHSLSSYKTKDDLILRLGLLLADVLNINERDVRIYHQEREKYIKCSFEALNDERVAVGYIPAYTEMVRAMALLASVYYINHNEGNIDPIYRRINPVEFVLQQSQDLVQEGYELVEQPNGSIMIAVSEDQRRISCSI